MMGFLNIYKPEGITSHDVVAKLRRITKIKQIGHTGTLDPFAEGVLSVCIGKATRLIEYLDDDKEYLATVQFGKNTSTYDKEGEITAIFDKKVSKTELVDALNSFKGQIWQLPPAYSAVKVNGRKLYDYARAGIQIEVAPRTVTVTEISLKSFDEEKQCAEIFVSCSKGTYIRSIAFDLGQKLSCGGYLTKLIRTKAGKFKVQDSIRLDEADTPEKIAEKLVNPLDMLELPQLQISNTEHEKVLKGQFFENQTDFSDFVILVYNNSISAVARIESGMIKVKKVFE